ncbi:MAG: glycoside hydrolase family 3 C-terminal domain-containing protein [Clostridiales bacterium]|nr:glycoside hydrolase family 3 C-terminal domain-containing protein [Clostridiales bacterium]
MLRQKGRDRKIMLEQTKFPNIFTREALKYEAEQIIENKCEALVNAMTIQEKMDLLYGWSNPVDIGQLANGGYNPGVPRLGIPEIRMYDGPGGPTCVVETTGFPQMTVLGCTWDEELAYLYGKACGRENSMISGNRQLGSQMDVRRSPQFGRNMKSEDPLLCAKLGTAEAKGIQENGVAATLKHFVAANVFAVGELADIIVDEQTLHEMYLRPFEEAIVHGGGCSVMAAYNIINGSHCSDNHYLLKTVLRDMWNYKGEVMSDWGANHKMSIPFGLDVEMPRAAFNDSYRILRGIEHGDLDWEDIKNAAKHVLFAMGKAGLLGMTCWDDKGRPMEEHGRTKPIRMKWYYDEEKASVFENSSKVAQRILEEGIVLAKNEDQSLPLTEDDIKSDDGIALIGLGAFYPICGELSERSFGRLSRMRAPKDVLSELTGHAIRAEIAIDFPGETIPGEFLFQDAQGKKHGLVRSYGITKEDTDLAAPEFFIGGAGAEFHGFSGTLDEYGELVHNNVQDSWETVETYGSVPGKADGTFASTDLTLDLTCGKNLDGSIVTDYHNGVGGNAVEEPMIRYTWRGYLKAPEDGIYQLNMEEIGGPCAFKICINGKWIVVSDMIMREGAHWPWESMVNTYEGMGIGPACVTLEKDKMYPVLIYAAHIDKRKDMQLRLSWLTPSRRKNDYEHALKLAENSKKVILFVNNLNETAKIFEKLGGWPDLQLPQNQVKLIKDISRAVHGHGGKLIVVLQSSAAHALGAWADDCDALLITHLTGQEGSIPLCRILLGQVNPSGKLAQTWPRNNEDTPISDSPEHRQLRYDGVTFNGRKTVFYDEGIFFGYRWYETEHIVPQFPFGHGLSYTTFEYKNMEVFQDIDGLHVHLEITNTGSCAGDEIIQIYLGAAKVPRYIQMAEKKLAAFQRVRNILPGETVPVVLNIACQELCYWNPALELISREDGTKDKWMLACGKRKIYAGASIADLRLEVEFDVKALDS